MGASWRTARDGAEQRTGDEADGGRFVDARTSRDKRFAPAPVKCRLDADGIRRMRVPSAVPAGDQALIGTAPPAAVLAFDGHSFEPGADLRASARRALDAARVAVCDLRGHGESGRAAAVVACTAQVAAAAVTAGWTTTRRR